MLLEKHLIACANVHEQVVSIYRWQGGIQREKEVVMVAKTTHERVRDAIALIAENHSYQIPAITAYPAPEGFAPFMQWVAEETA
jgi:periplasmic divalent cation tolerance protein